MTRSDFALEDLKTKAITVYLCLPLNTVTGYEGRWLRMFVMLALDMFDARRQAPRSAAAAGDRRIPGAGQAGRD